jgi:hypothetical protein
MMADNDALNVLQVDAPDYRRMLGELGKPVLSTKSM